MQKKDEKQSWEAQMRRLHIRLSLLIVSHNISCGFLAFVLLGMWVCVHEEKANKAIHEYHYKMKANNQCKEPVL